LCANQEEKSGSWQVLHCGESYSCFKERKYHQDTSGYLAMMNPMKEFIQLFREARIILFEAIKNPAMHQVAS
jgi:hypothetical protein